MFVAATTQCFPDLPLEDAIEKLADLEFSHIEIGIYESSQHLKPSEVRDNLERAFEICNSTRRLTVTGFGLEIAGEGDDYLENVQILLRTGQTIEDCDVNRSFRRARNSVQRRS